MIYENPQPEEGINYSTEHPLKEFGQLLLGVLGIIVLAIFILNIMAATLASQIPFKFEQKMVAGIKFSELGDTLQPEPSENSELSDPTKPSTYQAPTDMQEHLQKMADRLTAAMQLADGITITVHYDASDVVNAFATLGGNLIFFQGLIDKVESEDELTAVMAHEIAHIKYRHPIVALGKGLTLAALAAFVSGTSGSNTGEWLIGNSANLSMLKYSRDQERAADAASAEALARVYGHIGGADQLFQHFSELEASTAGQAGVVEMFRSHPYSENRWQELQKLATERNWPTSGTLSPLAFPDRQ